MSSKLLENKQLIHIASEVVVLLGLTFYFSSKNKKLMGHIEELAQKIESQEDQIQKLETTLQQAGQIMGKFNNRLQVIEHQRFNQQKTHKTLRKTTTRKRVGGVPTNTSTRKKIVKRVPVKSTPVNIEEVHDISEDGLDDQIDTTIDKIQKTLEDAELDNEISQELEELQEGDVVEMA